jgi:hypothetical protein
LKLISIDNYVEQTIKNQPAFVVTMSDRKQYLSHMQEFVEYTDENLATWERTYGRRARINLVNSSPRGIDSIPNANFMFCGCKEISVFDNDMPNLSTAMCLFDGCKKLTTFISDLPKLKESSYMFKNCVQLSTCTGYYPNIAGRAQLAMFYGCKRLKRHES